MPLETARQAVCGYRQILRAAGRCGGEYHFFGGEPLYAPAVVESVVDLATALDGADGGRSRFEITTNGVCSPERAEWLAERFDTVVLSLDGPPRFHDRSRVHRSGGGSSASVMRTARILSQGPTELIIRCCVTSEMADSLAGTAEWLVGEFRPAMVCFETLTSTPESRECGLRPPDPWTFARGFDEAAGLLERHGVPAVLSTADLGESRRTCCPVGRDALIVSPDGSVGACYLRREDWERAGLDLTLGRVGPGGFELCPRALERARACGVDGKRRCLRCLCRWHCAGGCHVRHPGGVATDEFDDACLQTRLVTVAGLLRRLGEDDVRTRWMASREALEVTARQSHDRWEEDGR